MKRFQKPYIWIFQSFGRAEESISAMLQVYEFWVLLFIHLDPVYFPHLVQHFIVIFFKTTLKIPCGRFYLISSDMNLVEC